LDCAAEVRQITRDAAGDVQISTEHSDVAFDHAAAFERHISTENGKVAAQRLVAAQDEALAEHRAIAAPDAPVIGEIIGRGARRHRRCRRSRSLCNYRLRPCDDCHRRHRGEDKFRIHDTLQKPSTASPHDAAPPSSTTIEIELPKSRPCEMLRHASRCTSR
jgi:hypothetical protein